MVGIWSRAATTRELWDRFMHDQRNVLFVGSLKSQMARTVAQATRVKAAAMRLRAQAVRHASETIRHGGATAALEVEPVEVVRFDEARVVSEGLVMLIEIDGRRVGIPRWELMPGTTIQRPGERGRLVVSRRLARDQGIG